MPTESTGPGQRPADRYEQFDLLNIEVAGGIATATIDAPPMNIMTIGLFAQLAKFGAGVAEDDSVRVVVLRSADPDFFIAHFDVAAILEFPHEPDPVKEATLGGFHRMCETYRTMPKATICEIAGRVGGGGNELAMSCDMRFGAIGATIVNQMEVPLGLLPGGTGTQRLPRLVGRGRAMEIILGAGDIDALTAERWGLLNRALPADELTGFVNDLAERIAASPAEAIGLAKRSIANADDLSLHHGLLEEAHLFQQTLRVPASRERMAKFLAAGGQTRAAEADLPALIARLDQT